MAALTVHLVTNIQIRVSCTSATAISFSAQIRNMESILGIFPSLLFYTDLILKIHNELFLSSCSIASVYVKPVVNKSADFCTRISNCCVNSFEDSLSWDWRHVCVLMIIGCQKHNYFEKCSAGYFFFSGASYCG